MHRVASPDAALCLIWGHRTPAEQALAHKAGRSKLDGVKKFSLHNYRPSLAADLWVYTGSNAESRVVYENRPGKNEALKLQLLQRGSLKQWYIPMGKMAEEAGLEAGALWRTFRDGPHVQVPKKDRMKLVQEALRSKGFDIGTTDGIIGPKTRDAIAMAKKERGVADYHKSRLMPVSPGLWEWLHKAAAS